MLYLHSRSPPVVHRDLKSANLLVDQNWHIKVSCSCSEGLQDAIWWLDCRAGAHACGGMAGVRLLHSWNQP